MKKIFIDTNIYSNAMKGDEASIKIIRMYEKILISPVVIGELLAGFRRGKWEDKNRLQLKDFLSRNRIMTVPISVDTAEFYSFILNELKKQGTPIPVNDIWIAASVMENGAGIATYDNHFSKIKGLIIINSA